MKAFKVFVGLFIVLGSLFSIQSVSAEDTQFSDVTEDMMSYEAINYLAGQGVLSGFEDGTFRPKKEVTRAEVSKIIADTLGMEIDDFYDGFSDVKPTDWYADYVTALAVTGVIDGFDDGTFKPNQSVKRSEVSKILVTAFFLESLGVEHPFTDVKEGQWYAPYVINLYDNGIAAGLSETRFGPNETVTREQIAMFVYRILEKEAVTAVNDALTFDEEVEDPISKAMDDFLAAIKNHSKILGISDEYVRIYEEELYESEYLPFEIVMLMSSFVDVMEFEDGAVIKDAFETIIDVSLTVTYFTSDLNEASNAEGVEQVLRDYVPLIHDDYLHFYSILEIYFGAQVGEDMAQDPLILVLNTLNYKIEQGESLDQAVQLILEAKAEQEFLDIYTVIYALLDGGIGAVGYLE